MFRGNIRRDELPVRSHDLIASIGNPPIMEFVFFIAVLLHTLFLGMVINDRRALQRACLEKTADKAGHPHHVCAEVCPYVSGLGGMKGQRFKYKGWIIDLTSDFHELCITKKISFSEDSVFVFFKLQV